MDAQRFDRLTQHLAGNGSRRRFAACLAVVVAGLGSALPPAATAKKKKKKKKCKDGAVKCGKTCVSTQTDALNCGGCGQACGANRGCVNGQCQSGDPGAPGGGQGGGCPANQILCGALCVDPRDNEQHCGACQNRCAGDLTCINGTCACAEGTACGNACIDTQTDDAHCGACNTPCASGQRCVAGSCAATPCADGERDCGGGLCIPDTADGCCVRLDCGPSRSGNDIECNEETHRCECRLPWGICSRHSDEGGTCGPCCPGGNQTCAGEAVCLTPTITGCGCPQSAPVSCGNGRCSRDPSTDSLRCGSNCVDCTQGGAAQACCVNGQCVGLAGCGPNVGSSLCMNSHCGTCGNVCGGDTPLCCNDGQPGATGHCIASTHGGICPPPETLARMIDGGRERDVPRRKRGRRRKH